MKTIGTIFKFAVGLIFVFIALVAIEPSAAMWLPDAVTNLLFGAGGLSMAAVATPTTAAQAAKETVTTTVTAAASPNLLRPEISNVITKVRPDIFPLDTILRKVGHVGKCDSREYKFYSSAVRGVPDVLTAEHTQADTETATISVTNIQIWLPDDVGFFPDVLDNDGAEIRFKVVSVDNSGSTIEIVAVNGVGSGGAGSGDYLPTLPTASKFSRIGNAKGEIDAQNTPYANMPTDTYNYVQIFMCQVEESLLDLQHNKEVEFNINDFQTDAIYDMRRMAEMSMIFGYPQQDVFDPVAQKNVDLMGGARHFITKTISYFTDVAGTNATFNSWGKTIFAGNNGSYTRMLFAGNGLVEYLMNIPVIEKQLDANKTEMIAGVKFKLIETFFGDLLLRRHQAFDDVPIDATESYTNYGLVLDMDNVERRIRRPTETIELKLDETGQRRVKANRILEEWTVAFRNEETHAWIEGAATP